MPRKEGIRRLSIVIGILAGAAFFVVFLFTQTGDIGAIAAIGWVLLLIFSALAGFGAWLLVRAINWIFEGFLGQKNSN